MTAEDSYKKSLVSKSTLQFLVAVLVFAEPFTRWHAIAVPMIWVALALYSVGVILAERKARKSAAAAAASSTSVT